VDVYERQMDAAEFYSLGLGEIFCISSINGKGTGDLLDMLLSSFKKNPDLEEPQLPRFTIIGRPNVGKSSLLNALLGEERNIVTPIAGTTRDSIYTPYNKFGYHFYLVDTAGLRKKGRIRDDIEFYSVMRSIRAIENSDVCLLMLDATQGIQTQDVNIFHIAQNNNKGIVVLVNKWDLVENKSSNLADEITNVIQKRTEPFDDVPVLFISAKKKQRLHKVIESAIRVNENRNRRIPTSDFNEFILAVIEAFPPPSVKGKYIRIKYATQLPVHYPAFVFFTNFPQYIKESYRRFLENKIREQYHFTGSPMQIFFRKK
jgi:GTP-binding protein